MNRRNFIRDIALSLAINLVPKTLRPIDSEIIHEKKSANEYVGIYWSNETYGFRSFTIESYHFDINKYRK